jgi:hypothetical protein
MEELAPYIPWRAIQETLLNELNEQNQLLNERNECSLSPASKMNDH